MFKMPAGSSGGSQRDANTRDWTTLIVMSVFLLAILGFQGYRGVNSDRMVQDAIPLPVDQEPDKADDADPIRRKVLEMREQAADPDQGGDAFKTPGEILPDDQKWLLDAEKADEEAANEFLPMLEEFRPLPPESVLSFRTRILDHVDRGNSIPFGLDGTAKDLAAVGADVDGLTVKDGAEQKRITWRSLPVVALYQMAVSISERVNPELSAREWLLMSRLATLAGREGDVGRYRERAIRMDDSLATESSDPRVEPDLRILDQYSWAWDDPTDPENAESLADDAPSIIHVYRFMRTLGRDALRARSIHNPEYGRILKLPATYRGKVIRLEARFVKRFKSMRMTRTSGHVDAGIQDLDFVFVVDAHAKGIYLVSVPHDAREFADSDIVTFTGVYIRRWPYIRHGVWKWVPWIAAYDMKKYELPPVKGWKTMTYILVGGAAFVFAVIAYFARRDSREGAEAREKLYRMRGGRAHIRRKVAEAVDRDAKQDDASSAPSQQGDSTDTGADTKGDESS